MTWKMVSKHRKMLHSHIYIYTVYYTAHTQTKYDWKRKYKLQSVVSTNVLYAGEIANTVYKTVANCKKTNKQTNKLLTSCEWLSTRLLIICALPSIVYGNAYTGFCLFVCLNHRQCSQMLICATTEPANFLCKIASSESSFYIQNHGFYIRMCVMLVYLSVRV